MDKQLLGNLIASLFLLFKFFIIPICTLIIGFIKNMTLKSTIKKAGKYYYGVNKRVPKKHLIIFIILYFILFIITLFFLLVGEWFILIIFFIGLLYYIHIIFDIIINNKYGNIYGIYENGIINDNKDLINWNEVHSYKIDENNVSGYYNNGILFEYKNIENIDEINKLFERNNIKKREN
jgi:hypothetical protein